MNNLKWALQKNLLRPKNKIYETPFVQQVEILSVELIDNIVYVNLSEEFMKTDYWLGERRELFIWSIVNTFTEIEDAYSVQILIEGQKPNVDLGGFTMMEPLPRVEDFIFVKKQHPSDVVIKFLDSILFETFLTLPMTTLTQKVGHSFAIKSLSN